MTHSYDPRAVRILFDAFWSNAGWKRGDERKTSPEDFQYARSKGVMFDPVTTNHDEIIDGVKSLVTSLSVKHLSNAFLSSLSSRNLPLRSALGSYAACYWMPSHSLTTSPVSASKTPKCNICGMYQPASEEDYNVLNFERIKWGGVRHGHPEYQLLDLREFAKLPKVEAKNEDKMILRNILKAVKSLPGTAGPGDAAKATAPYLKSNEIERRHVLETLSFCGILQPAGKSGFFKEFTIAADRDIPPVNKTDWAFPMSWWRCSSGINLDALDFYFPDLGFN